MESNQPPIPAPDTEPIRRSFAVEIAITLFVLGASWALACLTNLSHRLYLYDPSHWVGDFFIATAIACVALIVLLALGRRRLQAELAQNRSINARLRQSEGEARKAEQQSRLLLESTAEGIYALDLEGRFLWLNPAAVRLFGYQSAGDLIGRRSHPTIHHTRPDGAPYPESECNALFKLGQQCGAGGIVQPQELLWRADGTSFYAEVRINPILQEGTRLGSVTAIRDLTERLRLEEQYRTAHKMEAVGRLAAGVAHDFNNLLTVIIGYTEILGLGQASDDANARRLHGIQRAGIRAAELVRQLLAYSRHGVTQLAVLPLNDILRAAEPALGDVLRDQVSLHLDLAPDLAAVRLDSRQIEDVLINLVSNASEAMPEGGVVRVRTGNTVLAPDAARALRLSAGDYVLLEIADSGVGMDAETQKHIFEPFFTTKPPSQGSGLGLAMALDVARQCQGAITVVSAPGCGTSVQIYLPAQSTPEVARAPGAGDTATGAPHAFTA